MNLCESQREADWPWLSQAFLPRTCFSFSCSHLGIWYPSSAWHTGSPYKWEHNSLYKCLRAGTSLFPANSPTPCVPLQVLLPPSLKASFLSCAVNSCPSPTPANYFRVFPPPPSHICCSVCTISGISLAPLSCHFSFSDYRNLGLKAAVGLLQPGSPVCLGEKREYHLSTRTLLSSTPSFQGKANNPAPSFSSAEAPEAA